MELEAIESKPSPDTATSESGNMDGFIRSDSSEVSMDATEASQATEASHGSAMESPGDSHSSHCGEAEIQVS